MPSKRHGKKSGYITGYGGCDDSCGYASYGPGPIGGAGGAVGYPGVGYPGYGGAYGLGTVGGYGEGCSGPFYGPYGIGGTRAHQVVKEEDTTVCFKIKLLPKCECACDQGSKIHHKGKGHEESSESEEEDSESEMEGVPGVHGMYRPKDRCAKGLKCGEKLKCKDKRCLSNGYGWLKLSVTFHSCTEIATFRWNIELRETFPVTHIDFHGPARYYGCDAPIVFRANQQSNVSRRLTCQVVGEQQISCNQANQILGGQWYVQVCTERFPCGELRGYIY